VKTVLSQTGEDSAIAYLGDDMTDEDAFRAVKPRGIAVLVRPQFRPTTADVWLRPPDELVEFMRHWRVP
jgi:trehalose-6-phosphatase